MSTAQKHCKINDSSQYCTRYKPHFVVCKYIIVKFSVVSVFINKQLCLCGKQKTKHVSNIIVILTNLLLYILFVSKII